jgi:hypothetical protein
VIKALLILTLLIIFLQDIKFRAVHWFLFPIVLALSIWVGLNFTDIENMFLSLSFFLFSMGFLTLYISLKHKKLTNITIGFFSWGDILLLLAIIPLFSFHLYLIFFTLGTIGTLLVHGIVLTVSKVDKTIPFAGYMSLFLTAYLIFDSNINQFILHYI